jgi:hypothetical protein
VEARLKIKLRTGKVGRPAQSKKIGSDPFLPFYRTAECSSIVGFAAHPETRGK